MAVLAQWLLSEPVHFVLVYLLAASTLCLQGYMLIAHLRARRAIRQTEFKLSGLLDRLRQAEGTVAQVRRQTAELSDPGKLSRLQAELDAHAAALLEDESESWQVEDTHLRAKKTSKRSKKKR